MKKLLLSLLIIGIIASSIYVVVKNFSNDTDTVTPAYIDFSPQFPPVQNKNELPSDITTILKDDVSPALKKVVNSIYRDNYYVFACNDKNTDSNVLIMTALYDGSVARDGYEGAYQAIKDWEKSAVAEIGHIIFPSFNQTALEAVNFVWFEPYVSNNEHIIAHDFYKALFYLGETSHEMHYGWTLNYVIFAPSQECLEGAMTALYQAH